MASGERGSACPAFQLRTAFESRAVRDGELQDGRKSKNPAGGHGKGEVRAAHPDLDIQVSLLGRSRGKRGFICCSWSPRGRSGCGASLGFSAPALGSSVVIHEAVFAELEGFLGSQSPEKRCPAQG